jgi:hypothetical protein
MAERNNEKRKKTIKFIKYIIISLDERGFNEKIDRRFIFIGEQ